LFGPLENNLFRLDEQLMDDIPQVSDLENEILSSAFSEKEIKEAVFLMENNKAPGPNDFPMEFYQYFWEAIKPDLMTLFNDFHDGSLPLHSLNFEIITLLPKKAEVVKIQEFRPICLLNVSFKMFTKVLANRINLVAQKVFSPSQTSSLLDRYILEDVVILHETIHEMHKKKKSGVILKLDFEKSYDKVKWPFLATGATNERLFI
jgi:hypothetical protein